MKEEYLQMPELSRYDTYFQSLGIDANSLLNKFIKEQSKNSNDEWFATQMDKSVLDVLKDNPCCEISLGESEPCMLPYSFEQATDNNKFMYLLIR